LKLFLEGSRLGPLNEWRLSVLLSVAHGAVEAYRAVLGLEDLESSPPHSVLQRPSTPYSATQRPSKLPVDNGSTAPFSKHRFLREEPKKLAEQSGKLHCEFKTKQKAAANATALII